MEKWFEKTLKDVATHNEHDGVMTVAECEKKGIWTPCDLIIREYLNNGAGSSRGFLGISPARCIRAYNYAKTIKQELIEKDLISEEAWNNSGFPLWSNYDF